MMARRTRTRSQEGRASSLQRRIHGTTGCAAECASGSQINSAFKTEGQARITCLDIAVVRVTYCAASTCSLFYQEVYREQHPIVVPTVHTHVSTGLNLSRCTANLLEVKGQS